MLLYSNIVRTFYSSNYKYEKERIVKFWNYFFGFFIKNIKRKFFISEFFILLKEYYIYDLLLFLKKFLYFKKFLKKKFKYFSYSDLLLYKKRVSKNNLLIKNKDYNIIKNLLYINKIN